MHPRLAELPPHEQKDVLQHGYGIYEVTLHMPDVGMNEYRVLAATSAAQAVKHGKIIAKVNGFKVAKVSAKKLNARKKAAFGSDAERIYRLQKSIYDRLHRFFHHDDRGIALLKKHGEQKVDRAISSTASDYASAHIHTDRGEIGSSDIWFVIRSAVHELGERPNFSRTGAKARFDRLAEIRARYTALKKMPKSELFALWQRKMQRGRVEVGGKMSEMDKDWLASDIINAEYNRREVEAAFAASRSGAKARFTSAPWDNKNDKRYGEVLLNRVTLAIDGCKSRRADLEKSEPYILRAIETMKKALRDKDVAAYQAAEYPINHYDYHARRKWSRTGDRSAFSSAAWPPKYDIEGPKLLAKGQKLLEDSRKRRAQLHDYETNRYPKVLKLVQTAMRAKDKAALEAAENEYYKLHNQIFAASRTGAKKKFGRHKVDSYGPFEIWWVGEAGGSRYFEVKKGSLTTTFDDSDRAERYIAQNGGIAYLVQKYFKDFWSNGFGDFLTSHRPMDKMTKRDLQIFLKDAIEMYEDEEDRQGVQGAKKVLQFLTHFSRTGAKTKKARSSRLGLKKRFEKSDDYARILMRPVTAANCGKMQKVAAEAMRYAKSVGDDDLFELAEEIANTCRTKNPNRGAH